MAWPGWAALSTKSSKAFLTAFSCRSVWFRAARAAASDSTAMRNSSCHRRSSRLATGRLPADCCGPSGGGVSAKLPRPRSVSTSPSACSRVSAERTTVRLTPNSLIRVFSLGSFAPGAMTPSTMRRRGSLARSAVRFRLMASRLLAEFHRLCGPGARLLAEGNAQPGAVRDQHAAVLGFEALVEQGIEPVEVFHPGLARVGGGEVEVDFHGEVRGEAKSALVGQGGQAQELGDAADARGIRLDDVTAVRTDQALVLRDRGQHLARGDGGVQGAGEVRVAFEVVRVKRFLDPDEVEFFQPAAHPQCGGAVPLLVGVHHEWDVPANVLADAGDAAQVLGGVWKADLDLDAADAFVQQDGGAGLDLGQGGVEEAARGVVGLHGVTVGAQELGQR